MRATSTGSSGESECVLDPACASAVSLTHRRVTFSCGGDALYPTWYDSTGSQYNAGTWAGTTWDDGVEFCANQGNELDGDPWELCPYETYCPNGGGQEPIGGRKSGDKWSPISDSPNKWVQVGAWAGSNANTCLGHDEIANGVHGDP